MRVSFLHLQPDHFSSPQHAGNQLTNEQWGVLLVTFSSRIVYITIVNWRCKNIIGHGLWTV
jgi:hypothetical protein